MNSVESNEIYWFVYHILWGLVYFVSFGEEEDIILHYANKNLANFLDLKNPRDYKGPFYDRLQKALQLTDEQTRDFRSRDLSAQFSSKEEDNSCVLTLIKDGHEKHYICDRAVLKNKNGTISGVLTTILDDEEIEKLIDKKLHDYKPVDVRHPSSLKTKSHTPRILVIDHQHESRKEIKDIFESLGCEVDAPTSERAAISSFKPGDYDLVTFETALDDWESSGYYLMKVFRESEENTDFHANFIVITSFDISLISSSLDFKKHQVVNIIKKPVEKEQLDELLKKYVWHELKN